MGKALAKQITTMSWTAKISLVLVCTILTSVFMYEGWYKPQVTNAAVATLTQWAQLGTGTTGTLANATLARPTGSNRLLVVAITGEYSAATTMAPTVTYGGQTLTLLAGTGAIRQCVWVGYLKEAGVAAATTTTLTTTFATAPASGVTISAAFYSGVDQTTPITASRAAGSDTAATTPTSGAINATAGGWTFYVTNLNGATTSTPPTGYTEHYDTANGTLQEIAVGSKTITATATEDPRPTFASSQRYGIVVASLNPAAAAPTITSVTPTSIVQGTATNVTINGTNLTGATVTYANGTVGTATTATATQIIIPITGTTAGAGTLTVTTAGGSVTSSITTTAAAPTVSSISPTSMNQGVTNQTLTINGTNLTGATLSMSGTGVTLGTIASNTGTVITVPVTITAAATTGARTLTVTTAGGSATSSFTVNATTPAPTITSVTPSSVVQGVATPITIVGTNLTGASVAFSNATAGTPTVTATQITVTATGTAANTGTVTVTTAGGSVQSAFTVTAAPVNGTTTGAMTFPTVTGTSLGVRVAYSGDSNNNNTCTIRWGTVSGTYPNTITATKVAGAFTATATGLTDGSTYYFQATFADADSVTGTNPVLGSALATSAVNSPLMHNSANLGTKYGTWGAGFSCTTCHNQSTTNIKRVATSVATPIGARPVVFTRISSSVTGATGTFGDDLRTANATASRNVCEVCHHQTKYHQYSSSKITAANNSHNNRRDCISCHTHAKGFAAGACDSCHGNPPTTATTGGPTGLATTALPSGQAGAHAIHTTTEGFQCNLCHNGSSSAMPGGTLEIGFALNPTNAPGFKPTINTGTFVGNSAITGATWASSSAGTTVTTAANTNTCAIYCHGSTLLSGTTATPAASWTGGTAERACGSCHGTTAAAVPGAVGKTNSHTKHVGTYNFSCTKCHANAGTTASVNYAHVDGAVQWRLSTATTGMIRSGATYNGAVSGSTTAAAGSTTYGSCSTLHCHSDGTYVSTGAALTTATAPAATWGTTLACTGCHAFPPAYANGTPKANSHQGSTHAAQTCDVCHDSVTYNATTATYTPSATLHANGAYNIKSTMGYTYATTGGTCATAGCHATMTWGSTTGLGCIDCHASTQLRTKGRPGTSLAAVSTEFGLAYGHKKTGRTPISDADCIVCHLEGNFTSGSTSTFHQDGNIDLRDPDGAGETPITNISNAAWTFQRFSTSYAAGSRTTTGHTSNTDIANVLTQKFCIKCHDANGATNTTARTAGGTAAMPFGGVNLGTNYTVVNGAIAAGGTINVDAQFATTNRSFHPVKGPHRGGYPTTARLAAPYNNFTRTAGTLSDSVVINCFDCHNTPAPQTRRTVSAHGNAAWLRGPVFAAGTTAATNLCMVCHASYTVAQNHGAGSAFTSSTDGGMSYTGNQCYYCHSSARGTTAVVRPIRGQDVHGNSTRAGGTAFAALNQGYAFIRAEGYYANNYTQGVKTVSGVAYTSQCSGYAGACARSSMGNYTPGGVF